MAAALEKLEWQLRDNPEQVAAAAEMRFRIAAWTSFVDGEVAKVRGGAELVRDPEFLSRSVPIFGEIKTVLNRLLKEEERLRTYRDAALRRAVKVLLWALGLAAAAGIPLLARWLRRLLAEVSGSYRESVSAAERRANELAVTMKSIGDAVIATDAKGRIDFLNPAAEELTGWSNTEAHGRPLAEVFVIFNEQTGRMVENPVEQVLREDRVVGLANHTVLRSRQGREVPIEDSAAPIRDEENQVRGVILVFHDVTEKAAQRSGTFGKREPAAVSQRDERCHPSADRAHGDHGGHLTAAWAASAGESLRLCGGGE